MDIEFDPLKDTANLAKHRVSLRLGLLVLENQIGNEEDTRKPYGERRFNAFAVVGDRLLACTYTMRGTVHRVISVRRASRQEIRKWLS